MIAGTIRKFGATAALGLLGLSLAGCDVPLRETAAGTKEAPATHAALPSVVQPYARIENVLACINKTDAVKGVAFAVGPFADSTGKINSVALGATGNYLPQGGSSAYLTDALRKAGATVVSTYFGPPDQKIPVRYAINGIFNSLDFGTSARADIRVSGIGPLLRTGWAQLSLTVQLDDANTRVNQQISMIKRPIRYQSYGLSSGRDFNGRLVTGSLGYENQEQLQFEALNGPIALGVADVLMRQFPAARAACMGQVEDLLAITGQSET